MGGILRVQDNDGRNIRLNQAKFIHTCPLSKDSAFEGTAQGVRKGSNSLSGLLAETWTKRWSTVSELEMLTHTGLLHREGFRGLKRLEC